MTDVLPYSLPEVVQEIEEEEEGREEYIKAKLKRRQELRDRRMRQGRVRYDGRIPRVRARENMLPCE